MNSWVYASFLVLQLFGSNCMRHKDDRVANRHAVNLDLPPSERWSEIIMSYKTEIQYILNLMSVISQPIRDFLTKLSKDINKVIPYPYNEELEGIAKLLIDSPIEHLLIMNFYYELNAYGMNEVCCDQSFAIGCTSIVAETLNGSILHAQNLDFDLVNGVHNVTIMVDFLKNGEVSYTGTTFAGYVGLITGQKPYKYTISFNEREERELWVDSMNAWMNELSDIVSFHARDVLARNDLDFQGAVATMSSRPHVAPSYIIIGGVQFGEGVVITKDRTMYIYQNWLNTLGGRWFLLKTNYEFWKIPPSWDRRRDVGNKAMEALTRANTDSGSLFKVLSTPPILNERTVYTVIMSAANPQMYTTRIRHYEQKNSTILTEL